MYGGMAGIGRMDGIGFEECKGVEGMREGRERVFSHAH